MSQKSFPLQSGPFSLEIIVTQHPADCILIGRIWQKGHGIIASATVQKHGQCTKNLVGSLFREMPKRVNDQGLVPVLRAPLRQLKNDVVEAYKR